MQTTRAKPSETPSKPLLGPEIRAAIEAFYPRYPSRRAVVLPALHLVNERLGYVPLEAVVEIAQMLGLAPAQVQDTLSFYHFFPQDKPSGKLKVWICRSISCSCCEGEALMDYLAEKLGVRPGDTTADGRVTLLPAECLGACDFAPAMLVNDTLYKTMTREKIDAFVEMVRSREDELKTCEPVLLANIHKPNSHQLAVYEAGGGYRALRKALKEMSPDDVRSEVQTSGLRGRGGAGFPTALKWSFLPKDHPGPIYLCVNADESEPGTFVNRVQMENDPHQVIEGIILSAYATKTTTAYLYIRYEYPLCQRRMQAAIDEAYSAGCLGKNILGSKYSLDLFIHRGAGAYVCGEETGLIESLEGKRAWPRIKPPFPAVEGLFRKPTVVNNVETLACVVHIIDRGAGWFRSIGVPPRPNDPRDVGSLGPKLYGISGHVNKPGCYEAPLGITAREAIDELAGGVWKGRKLKAVVPGGLSTGVMTADELDTPMDFSSLMKVGCLGLGTACLIVMDETYSMMDFLYNSCRFYAHESCGQCTPCREGTHWSMMIMDRIKAGRGRLIDLDYLLEIGNTIGIIPGTTICGLADGAAWPIKTTIHKYREELEDYIKRTNPTGFASTEPAIAIAQRNGRPH